MIIDAILNDELDNIETQKIPIFNLDVPVKINNLPAELLDPRNTWESPKEWEGKAINLAKLFKKNFEKFCDNDEGIRLLNSGPQI